MKDPIPLTNEELLENLYAHTLDFCHALKIPQYAFEEFQKFPLPARFIIMGILLDGMGKEQEETDQNESKINITKSAISLHIAQLLLKKTDESLTDKYYDYWASIGRKWWESLGQKMRESTVTEKNYH